MQSVGLDRRPTSAICVEYWFLGSAKVALIRERLSQALPAPFALAGLEEPCRSVLALRQDGEYSQGVWSEVVRAWYCTRRVKQRLAREGERITKARNGSLCSLRRRDRQVVPPYLVLFGQGR